MEAMVEKKQARRPAVRVIGAAAAAVALLVGAAFGVRWLVFRLTHVTTDAAYVKADMVAVAPEIPGRVTSVPVREGDRVRQGQVLLTIEDTEWQQRERQGQAALDQATEQVALREATLARTRATVEAAERAAEAGVEAARQQQAKADAGVVYLEAQERRLRALLEEQAVPKARWDETHAAADAARADLAAAREGVSVAEARLREAQAARHGIQEASAGLVAARAAEAQARAAVAQVSWNRGHAGVKAPTEGVIGRVFVRAGDFAAPGRPAIAMYDPLTRYVEARFEETRIEGLRRGVPAVLGVDAYPGQEFSGKVRRVVPAAAQEFALIPRDVTAGEFTKVTQRVAVEIDVLDLARHPELVPGLSVTVACPKNRL